MEYRKGEMSEGPIAAMISRKDAKTRRTYEVTWNPHLRNPQTSAMSEQYIHLLIAEGDDFTPSCHQVGDFFCQVMDRGFLPTGVEFRFAKLTGVVRQFPNPFTGEMFSHEEWASDQIADIRQLGGYAQGEVDYSVLASATVNPRLHLIPIEFEEEYDLSITCNVHSELRCTSTNSQRSNPASGLSRYKDRCKSSESIGQFDNPQTGHVINVPNAGCARFWIEIELGKFLFPKINNDNLAIVNPTLLAIAEDSFSTKFAQGCLTY